MRTVTRLSNERVHTLSSFGIRAYSEYLKEEAARWISGCRPGRSPESFWRKKP